MSGRTAAALAVPKHIQGRTVIATLPKKLAKRAILSQNHLTRRQQREDATALKLERHQYFAQMKRRNAFTRMRVQNERAWRKEDWTKGPLAPKRDAGQDAETYGALNVYEVFDVEKPEAMVKKDYGIVAGDRVCVIKRGHREMGRIGIVKEVKEMSETVILEGFNAADIAVPEYMLVKETDKSKIRPFEMPIPLRDVRLVAALPDPGTGKLRDHIINELSFEKITRREKKGLDPPTRYITNLDPPQFIPYPEKDTEDAEEHDIDTLRIEVDEKTWTPTLHMPPMPPSVLDELRNKFSKLRFRHNDEYIAKLEKVDRKQLRKARTANMMMTPLKQARRLERKERRELGRPELDDESLAKIGAFMESRLRAPAVGLSN